MYINSVIHVPFPSEFLFKFWIIPYRLPLEKRQKRTLDQEVLMLVFFVLLWNLVQFAALVHEYKQI